MADVINADTTDISKAYDVTLGGAYAQYPLIGLFNASGLLVGYTATTQKGVTEVPIITLGTKQIFSANSSGSLMLPPNCILEDIFVRNNTASAITGGLKFGTTAGAADIMAAFTVGANATVKALDSDFLKVYFSKTASQQIFIDAVTAWNSASVDIIMMYYQLV